MLYESEADNFENDIKYRKTAVAVFYADWCGFCERFCPEFREVANESKGDFLMVNISDETHPLWDRYNIEVVPTLILFRNGSPSDRKSGKLEKKDLLEFMRKHNIQ